MGMEYEPVPLAAPPPKKPAAGGRAALKLLLALLLVGLAMRLLADRCASRLLPPTAPQEEATGLAATAPPAQEEAGGRDGVPLTPSGAGRCDLFHGEWVHDSSGPAYTNATCRFIETPQNCMSNGRPDDGYLYWKWKPYGCEVPPFEGKTFLEDMRGKHWALVGDSILRNHVQSLLCLLSKVEDPTEVYHDKTYQSRRWHFPSHNFTLSLVWAPFLVKAEIFEDENGISSAEPRLTFDVLDANWVGQWSSFDYVIISTGQWFFKKAVYLEKGAVIGCHFCQDKSLREVSIDYSFRRALREAFRFITASAHRPVVFYRTWSPSHFEGGEWFSGGRCDRKAPFKPREAGDRALDNLMWRVERAEFAKAAADDGGDGGRLRLLDTFEMSLQRPDAHAGPYRAYQPFANGAAAGKVQNDCLHWCLPGPIEAWNDIIMQMLAEVCGLAAVSA